VFGWLPGQEVTLLLGAAGALGCLALGVLELLWPTGARRVARPRTAPGPTLSRLAAPARLSSARLAALDRARAELWADYQRLAFRRLAATTPRRATALRAGDAGR
jgi:hypothetical protein